MTDKDKQREYQRQYRSTPEYKANAAARFQEQQKDPAFKEKRKQWAENYKNSKGDYAFRKHSAEYMKSYRASHPEFNSKAKARRAQMKANGEGYEAKARLKLRVETLLAYGGCCACCGEDKYEFLAIDHKNNNGSEHRKSIGGTLSNPRSGGATYRWLRINNYPEGFQVLCHNCNFAKGHYGYCPHQEESKYQESMKREVHA